MAVVFLTFKEFFENSLHPSKDILKGFGCLDGFPE
jgi:hypothetical protein